MVNSRSKGKRGELEARDEVRAYWFSPDCVRAAQVSGKFSADLLDGPPGLHLEVKRRKSIAATDFWRQAHEDANRDPIGRTPVVLMRENGGPWLVMFDIKDTQRFVDAFLTAKQEVILEELE